MLLVTRKETEILIRQSDDRTGQKYLFIRAGLFQGRGQRQQRLSGTGLSGQPHQLDIRIVQHLESETLLGVAERGGHVVATGGGILTVERNIPIIKGSGIVVFLNRDISILLNAKTANRPLIRGGREAVLKLYAERIETYRKCADLIVNPDSAGCIGRILDYYKRITE